MNVTTNSETLREAVAIFDDRDRLQDAAEALQSSGFDRADLSLLANDEAVKEKLSDVFTSTSEIADDPDAPRIAFVAREDIAEGKGFLTGALVFIGGVAAAGSVVASGGGSLAAALAAAAAGGGGGGLVGIGLTGWMEKERAEALEQEIAKGGLVLWVRTPSPEAEAKATEILRRFGGKQVHVHDLPAAS